CVIDGPTGGYNRHRHNGSSGSDGPQQRMRRGTRDPYLTPEFREYACTLLTKLIGCQAHCDLNPAAEALVIALSLQLGLDILALRPLPFSDLASAHHFALLLTTDSPNEGGD